MKSFNGYFILNLNVIFKKKPCVEVFWFPIVSDQFCDDMIAIVEEYGQWSGGRNNYEDKRLPGGYENVPTVDIHLKQVDLEEQWKIFLNKILFPMVKAIYIGLAKEVGHIYLKYNYDTAFYKTSIFSLQSQNQVLISL
jgi:lysyl hydroxylase/galactosyltransferase/glucosyltransferase